MEQLDIHMQNKQKQNKTIRKKLGLNFTSYIKTKSKCIISKCKYKNIKTLKRKSL